MNENTGNLKPLQIINPMTGRKIFVGTKTYKDLQNQGMIPKDVAFNTKKLGKAEPMFKVMNKSVVAETKPKEATFSKQSLKPKTKSKAVVAVASESSSEDDNEDALEKILAKSKKTKTKRPPTPQPSSDSESESDSSSSDSSD